MVRHSCFQLVHTFPVGSNVVVIGVADLVSAGRNNIEKSKQKAGDVGDNCKAYRCPAGWHHGFVHWTHSNDQRISTKNQFTS